jgi:hypothetical protein
MIRRFLIATLMLDLVAMAVPPAASAENRGATTASQATRTPAVRSPFHPLNVKDAARAIVPTMSARQHTGTFFSRPRGKATVAAAIIVAAVAVGYAASKGPDPTPATAR